MSLKCTEFLFVQLSWAEYKWGIEGEWVKGDVCIWDADLYLTLNMNAAEVHNRIQELGSFSVMYT